MNAKDMEAATVTQINGRT